MKTYSTTKDQSLETQTVWEAFTAYLNNIYFEGAADELDPDLVDFEYERYLATYS